MTGEDRRRRLVVITDSQHRIVASALTSDDDEIRFGVEPLAGQSAHELDLPEELALLETPQEVFAALEDARLSPSGGLTFRELRREK